MNSEFWEKVMEFKEKSGKMDEADSYIVRELIKLGLQRARELKILPRIEESGNIFLI